MPSYPEQRRTAVLSKLLPPHNRSVPEVAREEGISVATLYNWRSKAKQTGVPVPGSRNKTAEQWSGEAKLSVVLETAGMNEEALSEYCRSKGLYPEQIARWRQACIAGAQAQPEQDRQTAAKLKQASDQNRELKKQIRRKDKALAESAALLVLQKKFQALWEDEGE